MAFFERPNKITCCLMVLITTVFTCLSTLASPSSLTYQGRILKSDGSPLEFNNVSFIFQVMDSAGTCLVYQEQVTGYDMVNSGGVFDVPIGTGTVQFPLGGASSVLDAFNNSSSFTCGACSLVAGSYSCANGSGTYTASAGDGRKLRVQFYDGSGWKTISPDSVIRSVPFAGYALSAQKLGTNNASDFLLKTLIPTCAAGTFLSWDGTTLTCAGVAGASGGTVTNVTSANSYLSISNGASTPQLTLNVGTTANTVAAGNDPRLLNSIQTGGSASGDLSGTYPGPAVVAIRGVGISSAVPSSGQFFKFNGTNWLGSAIAISDVTGLSASLSSYLTQSAFNSSVSSAGCSVSQTLYWNSVSGSFQCQAINVGLAGDVSGSIGATSVDKIKGVGIDFSTAPSNGQVLKFNGTNWAPASDSNAGGTVTAVSSSNSYLSVASGTSTPTLTLNVGSAANTVAAGNDARITNAVQNGSSATLTGVVLKDSGSNTATLQAPNAIGASYVLKLPTNIASSAGQVLSSDTSGNLSWVTPSTTATSYSGVLPIANGGTNSSAALTGNKIMISSGASIVEGSALTNGQLLIGSTGAAPVAASLTAGSGITITPAAGAITIATTGLQASTLADGKIWVGQTGTPTAVTPGGDVTMTNAGVYTVGKIQGTAISATTPTTSGQVLRYNGSSWTPNFVSMFDLRSTITGTQAFSGVGCTPGQTLTWTVATDNLSCSTIAITDAQITYGSQAANTFLAAPSGSSGAPVYRTIAATDLPSGTLSGAGTAGYVPYYNASTTLVNSPMFVLSGNVGIGTSTPSGFLDVEAGTSATGQGSPISIVGQNSAVSNYAGGVINITAGNASAPTTRAIGGTVTIKGGQGAGSSGAPTLSRGGPIILQGGQGGPVGVGGAVILTGGVGGSTSGTGGPITISGGIATEGAGGVISIVGGSGASSVSAAQAGGVVTISGGAGVNGGASGAVGISGGSGILPGNVNITGGAGTAAAGGSVFINGGTDVSSAVYPVVLQSTSGNVGIGTAAPNSKLDVTGVVNASAGFQTMPTQLATSSSNYGSAGVSIYSNIWDGSVSRSSAWSFLTEPGAGTNAENNLVLRPFAVSTQPNTGLTVMGNTIAGSNTNSPVFRLGSSYYTGASTVADYWQMQNIVGAGATPTSTLTFSHAGSSGTSQYAFTNGNVGIGTTSPQASLDVRSYLQLKAPAGTYEAGINFASNGVSAADVRYIVRTGPDVGNEGRFEILRMNPSTGAEIDRTTYNTNGTWSFPNAVGIQIVNPSYTLHVNGSVAGTSAYNNLSDARLKRNIANVPEALEKINSLRGVSFEWRKDEYPKINLGDRQELGVIAQEVEKVFPQAVSVDKNTGIRSVAYSMLIAPLIEATKEIRSWLLNHDREIASVKAEVSAMKAENERLKVQAEQEAALKNKEIAELKARLDRLEKTFEGK